MNRVAGPEAVRDARQEGWPGRVRALVEEFEAMQAHHASFAVAARSVLAALSGEPPPPPRPGDGLDLAALLEAYERSLVLWALARTEGRQLDAARLLGVRPSTLNEKMKRLGIVRPHASSGLEEERASIGHQRAALPQSAPGSSNGGAGL